jgi:predicted transcriptional regulator
MEKPSLGNQELALLRYVTEHEPVTMGEVAEGFGQPQGLTRSTILTVMERLRKKGYLTRKKTDDVFRYSTSVPQDELLGGLVSHFVEKTLAGSLAPFIAYFARSQRLSDGELAELKRLIEKLQVQDKEAEE